ncbi:hypothetical protein [Promicromonospora aerolata]|uniref:Uncharacterized protein n=1 Tax=Promicromonospora aerolata TaxID=195749 RepID=A0ABW4V803_9MICO
MSNQTGPEQAALAKYVPDSWGELKQPLDIWKQGDLLGPIPWGWVAPSGIDPVTNLEVDAEEAFTLTLATDDTTVIVTSQTCDVLATGPGARHPFVQVSPAVEATGMDPSKLVAVRRWETVDLVLLDPPDDKEGVWIADLRVSVPVSKAVLSQFAPRPGFRTEQGFLDFAAHLAAKVERPALHDFVTVQARKIIQDAIGEAGTEDTDWWTEVDEVRVRCTPTRLTPKELEFLVIARGDRLSSRSRNEWRRTIGRVKKAGKPHGIEVMHPIHFQRRTLLAQDYRSSSAVDIKGLRRVPDIH